MSDRSVVIACKPSQSLSVLAAEGLAPLGLNVLVPNEESYTALLMQPQGDIEISGAVFATAIMHWQMRNLGITYVEGSPSRSVTWTCRP